MIEVGVKLYRIGLKDFHAFDGKGAFLQGGRWNTQGSLAVYAAYNISAARLEVLAHTPIGANHRHFTAASNKNLSLERLDPKKLPAGWDAADYTVSSGIGDEWLSSKRTLLLQVPSVASPIDYCVVVNPEHPEFAELSLSEGRKIVWPKAKK